MPTPMQWAPVEQAEEMEKDGPWQRGTSEGVRLQWMRRDLVI